MINRQIKMANQVSLYLLLFFCSACSCSKVRKYPFQIGSSNPIEYVYQMPLDELREKIIFDFESQLSPDMEEIMCN